MGLAAALAGVALLALPRLFEDLRLNQAARQVMIDLMGTRTQALAQNTGRRLAFKVDAENYQPQRQLGGQYVDDGPPIAVAAGVDIVECTAAGEIVTFRPRGNATTFGTITLRNQPGHERRVVIDIAGRVRVE